MRSYIELFNDFMFRDSLSVVDVLVLTAILPQIYVSYGWIVFIIGFVAWVYSTIMLKEKFTIK